MKALRFWYWIGIAAAISGCGVAKELCRYTKEQIEYHEIADECLAKARYRKLAEASLNDYVACNPGCEPSADFAEGFKDGFVDYVNEGPGAPPIFPPRCYWKIFHENPDGYQRTQEWFEGFRDGVLAAEQSGYRQFATVPVSLPE